MKEVDAKFIAAILQLSADELRVFKSTVTGVDFSGFSELKALFKNEAPSCHFSHSIVNKLDQYTNNA